MPKRTDRYIPCFLFILLNNYSLSFRKIFTSIFISIKQFQMSRAFFFLYIIHHGERRFSRTNRKTMRECARESERRKAFDSFIFLLFLFATASRISRYVLIRSTLQEAMFIIIVIFFIFFFRLTSMQQD